MIVLTNTSAQTIEPGQTLTFNEVILHTGCAECHRPNSGAVRLRANGIFEIHFSANVSGAVASTPLSLNVAIGGEPMLETTMISTPAAADTLNNVSTETAVRNSCGDYDRITVMNTGTTAITIGVNPALFIKRIA